jgi:hypothetical protein
MVASFADWWIERWGLNCNVGLPVSRLPDLVSFSTVFIIPLHKVRAPSEEKLPTPMPPEVAATVVDDNPETYEERHVHAVYDHIASHFSSTRYKVAKITIPYIFLPF